MAPGGGTGEETGQGLSLQKGLKKWEKVRGLLKILEGLLPLWPGDFMSLSGASWLDTTGYSSQALPGSWEERTPEGVRTEWR